VTVPIADIVDYTQLPAAGLQLREDTPLRPTIINVGDAWPRTAGWIEHQDAGRHGADHREGNTFDLLDALSRFDALCIENASLNVVTQSVRPTVA
jgi:hypothetical protein